MIDESPERARDLLETWLNNRDGVRGVSSYRWLVHLLMKDGEGAVIENKRMRCVAVRNSGRVWMCAAEIIDAAESDERAASESDFLSEVRLWGGEDVLCGLALPGDRATKNLFESLGMPAQVLLH